MRNPCKQSGFSLIELLVTIVVFSVGLLTVAGLQAVSKRANYEALQRSTASHVAYGLLEDMRANGPGLAVYAASADLGGGSIPAEPVPNCNSTAAPCSGPQLAAHDLWFWEQVLDGAQEVTAGAGVGGLVSPTLCIAGAVGGLAGTYVVTVVWRGTTALTDPAVNDCGAGSGNYGDNNEYRRMLQVTTFLDPII